MAFSLPFDDTNKKPLKNPAALLALWQKEGLIGMWSDRFDSEITSAEAARELRKSALRADERPE